MAVRYDLKRGKALSYPVFGETLFSIATANLPVGVPKDKKSVVAFFRKETRFGFDPSCTYAWLKGDVLGPKPLVVGNFKRIMLYYIGKNGLKTIEEINSWVASGPKQYADVLSSEEIQNKLHASKIFSQGSGNFGQLAERQRVWENLVNLVKAVSEKTIPLSISSGFSSANLIVIQGPPGVGKTMFLNRLGSDPAIQARFDIIFQSNYGTNMSPQTFLVFCLHNLLPEKDWGPVKATVLKADLKNAVRGKRILLLADNISSPDEIEILKPFCETGCLLVVATRYLEVARQADYSNVIELNAYSISDIVEYYSRNHTVQTSLVTQDNLFQLAQVVCYNPLGLNIALRRVAEEGWETVMNKVQLAPPIWKGDIYKDLHKPLWLAYSSLSGEEQDKFRRLGLLPALARYDEERLSFLWGVSKAKTNEILLRLEKEAGLTYRCPQKADCWRFHPQVLNYARYLMGECSFFRRILSRLYLVRIAFHEKRPELVDDIYKFGIKVEVVKKYWQRAREESKRRRMPIVLAHLCCIFSPSCSIDWSIFTQLSSICSFEDYSWGYRNYLAGQIDIWSFSIFLFLIGILGGLQRVAIYNGVLKMKSDLLGILNLFLLASPIVWASYLLFRGLRRWYDWAQLWYKITSRQNNHQER